MFIAYVPGAGAETAEVSIAILIGVIGAAVDIAGAVIPSPAFNPPIACVIGLLKPPWPS